MPQPFAPLCLRRLRQPALGLAILPLLAGCPLLWVEGEGRVEPSRSLDLPNRLPGPEAHATELERWRRTVKVGLGGEVELLLRDPSVVAAEVARDAAVGAWDQARRHEALAQAWRLAFGPGLDRFTIDWEGRFDRQFQATGGVLDPSAWRFELKAGELSLPPLAVVQVLRPRAPEGGFWVGRMRLSFPWREPRSLALVLGGLGPTLRLKLTHHSGSAEATWRFRSPFSP